MCWIPSVLEDTHSDHDSSWHSDGTHVLAAILQIPSLHGGFGLHQPGTTPCNGVVLCGEEDTNVPLCLSHADSVKKKKIK